jgi:tRNA threonylcarbamoyl adenosine modification protein YeaZ
MLVAIDTSTEVASLALVKEGVALAEITWRTGQNHTVQLLPTLQYLLKTVNAEAKDITTVAVAKGPGSFNGLRVGISTAKGLAYSLDVPIVGVSSLEIEAYQYAETGLPVRPVFGAGRNEIATALFRKTGNGWRQLEQERISTLEQVCAGTAERTLFCGEYMAETSSRLQLLLGDKAVITSPLTDLRRAAYLAELAAQRIAAGQTDNVATLQPIYLRRPPITLAKQK